MITILLLAGWLLTEGETGKHNVTQVVEINDVTILDSYVKFHDWCCFLVSVNIFHVYTQFVELRTMFRSNSSK